MKTVFSHRKFLALFVFFILNISATLSLAGGQYRVSWVSLKKRAEDFYRVPELPVFAQDELAQLNTGRIEKLGARLSDFDKMVNLVDLNLTVKELMISTSTNGLPIFGGPDSTTNQDVRNMMFFILDRLDQHPKSSEADRLFQSLATGFTNCQQVQYRTIRDAFHQLMDQSSLKVRVALLVDDLKRKWLMQTIFHMEKLSVNELDPHLENAYLKAIGKQFGIPAFEQALVDPKATKVIDHSKAQRVFRSFVNAEEIISSAIGDFANSDPQKLAEIFQWVSDRNYQLDQIYDENGHINKSGTEAILSDLAGVIVPVDLDVATEVIKRQEFLLESFFPSTGYSSWIKFDKSLRMAGSLSSLLSKVIRAFDQDHLELAVYAPEARRRDILRHGILNQYQAGSSKGFFGFPGRFAVERSHLNMTEEEYEQLPLAVRPKYGKILSKKLLAKSIPISAYGNDVYLLRLEALKDRLTWTPGDSLNRHQQKAIRAKIDWRNGDAYEPSKWDDLFLPWSKIGLLVPFLDEDKFFISASYLPKTNLIKPHTKMKKMGSIGGLYTGEAYAEFQAWGEISPSEIKEFIFSKSPPDRKLLRALAKYQIRTLDGSHVPPTPYRIAFYETADDKKCHKLQFDVDHLSILEADAEPKFCDLAGIEVYDSIHGEWGTIRDIIGDGSTARVQFTYLSGHMKDRELKLDQLFKKVERVSKNTPIGEIEYMVGDNVYNSARGWFGYVSTIYEGGFIKVRYPIKGGTEKYFVDSIEQVHKKLSKKKVKMGKQIFQVNGEIYDRDSGEWGTIQYFYSSPLAYIRFTYVSVPDKFRYIGLDKLHVAIEKFSKASVTGTSEYMMGDIVYNPQRKWWGYVNKLFHSGYIQVRYPMRDKTEKCFIEFNTEIHKKLALDRLDHKGLIFTLDDEISERRSGARGYIQHFYDNGLAAIKFTMPSEKPGLRYIFLKNLDIVSSKNKPIKKSKGFFQRLFSKEH